MRASSIFRIRILTAAVLLGAAVLVVRLYQVQIMHRSDYRELGERQYVHTAQSIFDRGSIFFTTKEGERVSAATLKTGYLLAVNPSLVKNPEALYESFGEFMEFDRDTFLKRMSNKEDTYEEIAHKLTEADAVAIKALALPGVYLYRDRWRLYPADTLASQTVGFVGYSGDTLTGRYGVERYYDDVLERDQSEPKVNFFAEIFANFQSLVFDNTTHRRGDVITTIEPTVERTLESELAKVHTALGSKLTGGIIMNPKTGEIYALGALPNFNLNDRAGIDDVSRFRNPLVEDVYELGSIIKPLTMASGIDAGAVNAATTYNDKGVLEMNEAKISNYDGRGRGVVSMQEVLNQSLNTGVAFVVKTMGRDRFREYFTKLGFGTETGIDLPSEARGLVDNLESPREIEYATASFGQGIAMTPVAAVRALAALANGGLLVTPHVVKTIRYENGSEVAPAFGEPERIFKQETSEEISRMLTVVVDKALRNGTKKLPHHSVAAKTGTAQIADSHTKKYYDDRYLHSFFGYFPAYDPQFIIFLYTVEPKDVQYASETLTDPFMALTQFLINYYDIPPDR